MPAQKWFQRTQTVCADRTRPPAGPAAVAEQLEPRALLSGSDLDPTFGTGGVGEVGVVASIDDRPQAMLVRPDGRFVVVTSAYPSFDVPILHGFLPDGRADPAFGTGGEVRLRRADLAGVDLLEINPDGSFLAGRTGVDAATVPIVRRLTAAGAIDPTWAPPAAALAGELIALAPLGDGRAFVVTTKAISLLRADGSLDPTFNGTGTVAAPATSDVDYVMFRGAAAGADGSVTVFAQHYLNAPANSHVPEARRYAADGSVDLAFGGGDGVATPPVIASSTATVRVIAAADGRTLFAGQAWGGTTRDVLVRLEPDGDPDPTFDLDGTVSATQIGLYRDLRLFRNVHLDAAGRIVLTAISPNSTDRVVRLNRDGSADASFGDGGIVYRALPAPRSPTDTAMAPLPDGSLLVAQSDYPTAAAATDLGVARLSAAGTTDPSFGTGGVVWRAAATNRYATVKGAAFGPDGRLVAVGDLAGVGNGPGVLAGFAADGTQDARVGPGGLRAIDPGAQDVHPTAVAVGPDGKTVVAGYAALVHFNAGNSAYIAAFLGRLNADGTPDATFGPNGTGFVTDAYGLTAEPAADVVVLADGRIVTVTARTPTSSSGRVAVRCYLPDGRADPSFGTNGVFDVRPVTTQPIEAPTLDLAADGTLLVTAKYGYGSSTPQYGRVVVALSAAGQLVSSFGTGGVADVSIGWDASPRPARDAAGNLYLFGTSNVYAADGDRLRAVRLTPAGQVDPTFGNTAQPGLFEALLAADGAYTTFARYAATADGRILAAGSRYRETAGGGFDYDALAVRLLPSGRPDESFGPGGELQQHRGGTTERFEWAAVRPDGRVVLAGTASTPDGRHAIAATRLLGDTPPGVRSVVVNDGHAQRSMVTRLTVTFDQPVAVDVGAFALAGRGGAGAGTVVSAANPAGDGRAWVLTFSGAPVVAASLADGVYDLTVAGGRVRAGSSAGGAMSADHVFAFHRLFADADGDRDVDGADSRGFRGALGSELGLPAYNPVFDYDADGDVDGADSRAFRRRLGTEI